MVKTIIVGIWAAVVALGASYAAISMKSAPKASSEPAKAFKNLETVKLRLISVPLVIEGKVEGYVMAQIAFTAEGEIMKKMSVKPDIFVRDEAFRVLFMNEVFDFRHLRKQDLPTMSKMILESVNKRLGSEIVHDVFVQDLTYLPKDQVRTGRKS